MSLQRLSRDAVHPVALHLNGVPRSGPAEPRTLLSDWLRHTAGATGTHVGCEHGVCGACTVRIDGVAARSCLMLAVQCDGRRVDTVEGLAEGEALGDLQAAFRAHHALQCGFCTAGILLSCSDWLERLGLGLAPAPGVAARLPSQDEVREMLSGHLCRCTGYTPIVQAVMAVAQARHARRTPAAPQEEPAHA
jgi:2-furoyl-CoA dehydrogenase 2Fe-2S iron sulfur subunit